MPLETTISCIIIAIIIGALFGGIIRIIQRNNNHKKQDPIEQKLDKVIQLLEKQNKDWPYLQTEVFCYGVLFHERKWENYGERNTVW